MKTFKIPQNNWVMTAALLAVLSVNVSFNGQQAGIASADFASTSGDLVESKLVTVEGVMPVKYVNNGESEVLAIVPKKMTEGKVCETCGYETIPLATKNKTDIDALNVQLLKAMQKVKPAAEAKEEAAAGDAEEKVVEKKNPFDAIEKACNSKRYKTNSEVLSCTSEKFVSLLRKKSGAEIDSVEALDFYKANIETAIKTEIVEARRLANRARRSALNPLQTQFIIESDEWSNDPSEILRKAGQMREDTLKVIRTILAGMPSKQEKIRSRLVITETEIAREEARELQQTFIQARDSKDASKGVYLFQEGELRRADLQDLMQGMQYHSNAGFSKALSARDLNADLQNQYETYINDFFQKIQDGMWQNPYGFMGAASSNTTLPGIDFGGRISQPGRGAIQGSSAVQLRGGTRINAGNSTVLLLPIPAQNNNSVNFSPISPLRGRQ